MVERTPEPSSSFYQWATDRYRRRAVTATWAFLAIVVVAVLVVTLLLTDIRRLNAENRAAGAAVRSLQVEVNELKREVSKLTSAVQRRERPNGEFVRCVNARAARFQDGLRMLVSGAITTQEFLARYREVDCS